MSKCNALTKSGTRCTINAVTGQTLCNQYFQMKKRTNTSNY